MNDIAAKFKTLELNVDTIENSRKFDSKTVEALQKKQTEMDALLSRMQKLETEQSKTEQELKAQVVDVQCRSMRDNLLSYRIPEERAKLMMTVSGKFFSSAKSDLKSKTPKGT